jgi:uncharacterized membrane protein
MRRKRIDLVIVCAVAVGGGVLGLAQTGGPLRTVTTLFLVLLLPGYALRSAVCLDHRESLAQRLLLGGSLSLMLAVLMGLVLHSTSAGLVPASWAIALSGTTIVLSAIGYFRRSYLNGQPLLQPQAALSWRHGLTFGLAIVAVVVALVVVAFLLARDGALEQRSQSFTQLWALPTDGADRSLIALGVRNLEAGTTSYVVRLRSDGQVIQEWLLDLQPGEQWEITTRVPPHVSASRPVEAVLSKADGPDVMYRRVLVRIQQPAGM